ncbi:MAG: AMP-binding protein [Gammaproteobacteria bacterium]|nr:AMP-binding protein [Gammaproteobacteria bacterium]
MVEVFAEAVASRADAPAIVYFDTRISWATLDDLSTRFASALAGWGVGHGDRVALFLQNVPQYLVVLYGSWKRGAIAVPLNPMLKHRELRYHLDDSGARVLVVLESLYADVAREAAKRSRIERVVTTHERDMLAAEPVPDMPAGGPKQVFADTDDLLELLARTAPQQRRLRPVAPDDVCALGYTSGTTGEPKGAMSTHANFVYNADFYRTWMRLDAGDAILGVAPLFHITGMVAHIAAAAMAQCPLILACRFDAGVTLRLIERLRPTMTVASITVFLALMNHPDADRRDLKSLQKCYSGGAPIAPGVADEFERRCGIYIHNIYGLTESTSPTHAVPLGARAPVDPATGALSVGVPIPGCDSKLVSLEDPAHDAPPGEAGEIADRGPMLFAGYWNRPQATAAAFHDGWFLTGDVATVDGDGYFYVVDRKKDMINVSGYKVWPREVEDVLYQHPAVREVAVIGVPDEYRGETVKACIALKPGAGASADEMVAFCRERLAAYKYPRLIEFVDELPKTATGKFLRRALRDKNAPA